MNIGLDIDNVISNFDKKLMEEFIKEDPFKRNKGIIKYDTINLYEKFDWTQEEIEEFFCNKCEDWAKTLELNEGAKYYIDKMINDGHNIFLISHRSYPHYKNPFEVTKHWLNSKEIKYTKLLLSKSTDKTPECKQCKVDIMFDDSVPNCNEMISGGINCFLYREKDKYDKTPYGNLRVIENWEQLYNEVLKLMDKGK